MHSNKCPSEITRIMQRRSELLAKIAAQREQVAVASTDWRIPLTLADRGLAVVRFMRSHPLLVAGAVSLLLIHQRGMMGLAKGAWRVWKGYRFITTLSGKISTRN